MARLAPEICLGAGRTVPVTGAEATFRTLTCPTCNRSDLGALDVREQRADFGCVVATVPPHRAKKTEASDVRLNGTRMMSTEHQQASLDRYKEHCHERRGR